MKPLRIAAVCLLLAGQSPAGYAQPAGGRDFAENLSRSIGVAGREGERFRIGDRMAHYLVPGVSVAVIENCRIVDVRGFGSAAPGGGPVTPRTLFQAGSISKVFAAATALRLVERGALSLDGDVRERLRSWRLPDSSLLDGRSITLRGLLSHTAGINQEGGNGYRRGTPLPSLTDILNGRPPANTAPIRVERAPGEWRYSGGGYYVAQALMQDATGTDYSRLIDRLVFRPLRLRDSSVAQPLDDARLPFAAQAAGPDGAPLDGGWRVNPELAAGGLWTTPADVARLAIAIARAVRGEDRAFLSPEAARALMTRGPGNWGLGVDLGPPGRARRFGHTGHTVGFSSEFVFYPDSCQGAVVMTNADQGGWIVTEVLRAIGDVHGWPDRAPQEVRAAIALTPAIAERFIGSYRLRDFPAERFTISLRAGELYWARAGHVGRALLPESDDRLFSPDSRMMLEAIEPAGDRARTLSLSFGGGRNVAERIGD